MRGGQFRLLLWKNYVVRKRRPAILGLVFLWPVAVFLLLYTVRDNVDPEYKPTCQFSSRLMPHDGLLPFVQSYICGIGNTCESLDDYEELPSYKNSTLGPLMKELQPMLMNRTILRAMKTLPKSIQLLKSMAQILTKPEIKKLFDRGIRLGDLFNDSEAIKSLLRTHLPEAEENTIDGLLNASIKLYYLVETFGSSNLDGVICSSESLKKYLIVDNDRDLREISKVLCNIDGSKIPVILERLTRHLDFSRLLEMIARVTAKFRQYDFVDDLLRALNAVLDLRTVKKYVPSELKLDQWLPKIVELFRNVTLKQINLSLINKAIHQLDPIFLSDRDWPTARHGLENLNSFLSLISDLVMRNNPRGGSSDTFELTKILTDDTKNVTLLYHDHDVAKIFDAAYIVATDGVRLVNRIIDRREDQLKIATRVLDGLKDFFPQNIMNVLTYVVSITENIVRITHHVAIIHEEIFERLHNVSLNNMGIVKRILTTVEPEAYRTVLQSISRLNFTERLVNDLRRKKPDALLCQEEVLSEMFQGYKDFKGNSSVIHELVCSDSGKTFVAEMYEIFEFDNFRKNVEDTLSTFISMAVGQPVKIEKSNLTSLVTGVKSLVFYLEKVSTKLPDWSVFEISEGWNRVFRDTRILGRIDVLGIHLSMAKASGLRSFSYVTIKPDLEIMDFIADMILLDLREHPTSWIGKVREHESELVESFYMTVTDRKKTLKILEHANFTRSYCYDEHPSDLVNYPSRSNATLLKDLVCRLARSVQTNLQFNRTEFEAQEKTILEREKGPFNWTAFNEKVLEIYEYIETLLPQIDEHYDEKRLKRLKSQFVQSWTSDLAVRDAWEISVGTICKLLDIIESPVFDVRSKTNWDVIYALGRAGSVLTDTIERIVDQIDHGNQTIKLSEIFVDLPRTEIFLDVLLRNILSLTIDGTKFLTTDLLINDYVSMIKEYAFREKNWPCIENSSLGMVFQLSNGTRAVIREMEKIACDPGPITKEWNDHGIFASVRKSFDKNNGAIVPSRFNWTRGYERFRTLTEKIDRSIDKFRDAGVTDDRDMVLYDRIVLLEMHRIIEGDIADIQGDFSNLLEHIDAAIDRNVDGFSSEKSASDLWTSLGEKRDIGDVLAIGKFFSRAIRGVTKYFLDVIKPNARILDLIDLMGFTKESVFSVIYQRSPYIVATIINGMSDPRLDGRAYNETMARDGSIDCSDVFSWFYDYRIGLTIREYLILKNSTCDADPTKFNAFTDLYLDLKNLWRQPVSRYRGYYVTLATEIWQLLNRLADIPWRNEAIVSVPFGERYFIHFFNTLKNALYADTAEKPLVFGHYTNPYWRNYRLAIEGISEILEHAIASLNQFVSVNDDKATAAVIHIWDLVESGDVREVLKIMELHPEEAIGLLATLVTYDSMNDSIVRFRDLGRVMCNDHFASTYWSTDDRRHFIDKICSFDPHQLLRRATSDEFYEAIIRDSSSLKKTKSLSRSLTKFLDTFANLPGSEVQQPRIVSNVFNATTWLALPDDTKELVRHAQKSWARKIASYDRRNDDTSEKSYDHATIPIRILETVGFLLDIAGGGDVWAKWKTGHESSRSESLFSLIEDAPNLLIIFVDTFVNSERLTDFFSRFFDGRANGCDIEKYLIPPVYTGRKDYLSSVRNFCRQLVGGNATDGYADLMPVQFYQGRLENKSEHVGSYGGVFKVNETRIFLAIEKIETSLFRLLKDGPKTARVPSWWTSFLVGAWKDFTKRYETRDSKPLARSIVEKIAAVLRDMVNRSLAGKTCSWCNSFAVRILNSQLSRHEVYSNLLCNVGRLNYSQIVEMVNRDLYWNRTINMIKSYEYLGKRNDPEAFVGSIKDTAQYSADIIVDYKRPSRGINLTECFFRAIGVSKNSGIGFYVKILIGIVDALRHNVQIFDTSTNHEKLANLTRMARTFVPIWRPLDRVSKRSKIESIKKSLPNATIDVNLLLNRKHDLSRCSEYQDCIDRRALEAFLSSRRNVKRLLRYDSKTADYPSIESIASLLAESLDFEAIDAEIGKWRRDASWNFSWLREILKHIGVVIEEGGNLLDIASKIDFNDISGALGVPDIADGVINLLKEKTIDKLFDALKEMVDDAEPFVEDNQVRRDLGAIVETLEGMEIFKNLGLLDLKYVVSEMFVDWNTLRRFIVDEMKISDDTVSKLSEARVDMLSIFMKERRSMSLRETVCSPQNLQDMLTFEPGQTSAEQVSSLLCRLNDSTTQNITVELIKNLNFEYIFTNLMSANIKNILKNANLTEIEGQEVLDGIGVAAELVPFFKDKLSSSGFPSSSEDHGDSTEKLSSGKFLQDASKMMCGKALLDDSGQFYEAIGSIEDNNKSYDRDELNTLPTDFCRDAYKNVLNTNGGKIVWSYVKPLLRGRILFSPNTTVVNRVMSLANETFSQIESFGDLIDSFEKTLRSLASLSEMGQSLNDLRDIMSSKVMKIAVKSMSDGRTDVDFSSFDIGDVAWKLTRTGHLTDMVGMLNDFVKCVLIDRFEGFANEEELEKAARSLMRRNEFLAGVVFIDLTNGSERFKRSLNEQLSNDIVYKIRMDVDYVPSTKRLKTQFWLPGPEDNFIEDLRYLRGFVQLQDSIDRAIIREKSGTMNKWKTVTQQMPYPCWKRVPFITTLYESQGIQVCFFFALMLCVGSAVRYIVWERESQNSMVMSVMGLKPWRNTVAWFVTTYIELTIVMLSIFVILIAGQILPHSDSFLVLILLLDYVFSIVTFCYMISTMFSSASLASVTTVIMFLLTYMPYVIVIAMEASMNLCWKIFICLSMSTSFSYGCLYTVRREVQGRGINWDMIWDATSPGDSMSFGLVLIMIALDGIIYALIGYFVAKYANSDENSDPGGRIINEKQIGVRFEAVRKVFPTDRGDFVAVDDFTLKLREGEVTSLLGRNGAGKTTIIKMLTGMTAPTSGEIYLNGNEGTKPDIGVCPQDNVLIDTLTPREHMIFYAKLKRSTDDDEETLKNVNSMLSRLELGRREHEPVNRLSGGTKRRLCVALAFLGSPKLVILDEPGAGVDPAARRRIWRLIDQHRANRTILLSTHHLDEADMLSDTVVMMNRGKILCAGSPLTLKINNGNGYRFHVQFPIADDSETLVKRKCLENLRSMVENFVSNVTINDTSATELVVALPFHGKHGQSNDIAAAVKVLEDNKKSLGFSHISLECDSLERVFLDLCTRADTADSALIRLSMESITSVASVGFTVPTDDADLMMGESPPNPKPLRQVRALLRKRLWHFTRDWTSPLATLFLPTVFVAVAMGFSLIRPPSGDEPPLDLSPRLYDTHPVYFYSIDNGSDPFLRQVSLQLHNRFGGDHAGAWQTHPNDTGICECTDGQQVCRGVSKAIEGLYQTLPGRPTLDWIVSTFNEYIEKRYGGWSLSRASEDPLLIVWYNNKGHHSLPSYLNALNEAVLRASGIPGRITILNHPLKLSSDQLNRTTLLQHIADVGVALVLLIAFSLVAAQGTKELVRERMSEEKRILYLAGVHPVTYWTTALIWDFLVFLGSVLLAVVVFEIFGLSSYVARDNLAGVCLLLVLFAWAIIPLTHLVEKAFDDSSLSNMVLFCSNTFVGVACLATILVIDILGKSQAAKDTRNFLHRALLLFPQYALGDALVEITKNDVTAQLLEKFQMDTYKSPLGWDLLGLHYVIMFVVGFILYSINLTIECGLLPDWPTTRSTYGGRANEDEDVARERIRVESGVSGDIIKTIRLRKEYRSVYGKNVAVENLSFGVEPGSCFGLLGVNGAGKSSTFRMLTTEIRPSSGRIVLRGREIGKRPLCNGEIGYCPQSDALDGFLSPHQSLTVHGEICGLNDVATAVESMLKRFDLVKYAHQTVNSLSGGNKRKLCAAISVMSPVSVVLMDEPTSGMDPASKEFVAKAIRLVNGSQGCVILTSHSVAECEKLCSRVGILAKAGLRCIGTVQHLKYKFGEGYVAFLRFGRPIMAKDLKNSIDRHLPTALISSRQAMTTRLLVPRSNDATLSSTLTRVRQLAEELGSTEYILTQTSLDQVLVNFSEELEDDIFDPVHDRTNRAIPNTYTNIQDTIHMETF